MIDCSHAEVVGRSVDIGSHPSVQESLRIIAEALLIGCALGNSEGQVNGILTGPAEAVV